MARLTNWMVLAAVAAVAVGCGPAKELPDEIPKAPDTSEKPVTIPTVSEPAAKTYLEQAVKAFTSGKPEQVAKGKYSRLRLTGVMRDPNPNLNSPAPIPATRSIVAVWPDRFADVDVLQAQGQAMSVSAYHQRPRLTVMQGTAEGPPPPNPVERELNLAADERGQYWMMLFQPMTDPKAVVFDLGRHTIQQQTVQQPVHTLKLSMEKFPVYQLYFDVKTDALVRVEYSINEQGTVRRRQWNMTDHKPGPEGLLLPGKMECRWDNVVVEEWAVEKWEFPASIDDAEFAPPKK
jgi:hypothetical protein